MSENKSDRVVIKFGPNVLSTPQNTKAYIDAMFNNANVSVDGVTYKVNNGASGYTGRTKNNPSSNYNTSSPDSTYDPNNPSSTYNATAEYDPNNPNSVYSDQNTFYPNKPASSTTASDPSNPNSTTTLNNQNNNVGGNNGSGGNGGNGISAPLSAEEFDVVLPPGNPTNPPSSGLAPAGYTFYVPAEPVTGFWYNSYYISYAKIEFDVIIDPVPSTAATLWVAPYNSMNNNPQELRARYASFDTSGWSNLSTLVGNTFHFKTYYTFPTPNIVGYSATSTVLSVFVDNVRNYSVGDSCFANSSPNIGIPSSVTGVNPTTNVITFSGSFTPLAYTSATGQLILTQQPVKSGIVQFDLNFDPENINRIPNVFAPNEMVTTSTAVSVLSFSNELY
jgi:hypothetical protein